LFKIGGTKYVLGVSATPERMDGLSRILKLWVGDVFYKSPSLRMGLDPKVLVIKSSYSKYTEHFMKIRGERKICFVKMISDLIEIQNRNKLIVDLIISLSQQKRKILVLTDRIQHVKCLCKMLKLNQYKGNYSPYIGTEMDENAKKKALESDIVIATIKSFGEGIDKSDLDTLILATPKRHVEENIEKNVYGSSVFTQIIGRIFRKKHDILHPLVVDIWDDFSVFKNQGYSRLFYYKKNFFQNKPNDIKTFHIDLDNPDYDINNIVDLEKSYSSDKNKEILDSDIKLIYNFSSIQEIREKEVEDSKKPLLTELILD
jgi:superfamily II DNA or RNA helicase